MRALREAGIAEDDDLIFFDRYSQGDGYRMAQWALALSPTPTAIFAANNLITFGAFQAVREAGLRIPEDISLVSFDDLPRSMMWEPFLTVAAQPAYAMASKPPSCCWRGWPATARNRNMNCCCQLI